ncbi:hypothetical protein ABZ626_11680 [Streptomyces longispororuber]|uniref:hypothetical protein n=1 Tax=Streptomyces longispororuber TaxID=68230 RepID=UPI0033FB9968
MKLTRKAMVPAVILAAAAGAGSVYLTTGHDASDGAREPSARSVGTQGQIARAYVGDPDDPATWRLPVESYMPTKTQVQVVTTSRDKLIDQCMSAAGFDGWKPAPDLPDLGGKTLTDWRYGLHDGELAAERGYHPAKDEQEAYDKAMEAGAVDESGADEATLKGCVQKVDGQVPDAQPPAIVDQISGESFENSKEAPEVVEVFAKWSSCMKGKGYDYKQPLDASDDPAFGDPEKVTPEEIATAKADVACRDEHNVERTWFDAESKIQRAAIAKHLKEFNDAAKATKSAVAKARKI